MKRIKYIFLFLVVVACVEEIDLKTETTFESVFVVEATITNELKHQEIKLSRAYRLGSETPLFESNAKVIIVDENNVEYEFTEAESGTYTSNIEFAAQPNIKYRLQIETSDGKTYSSPEVTLTKNTLMDNLYFERGFNENGEEGVSAFVDAYDPTGESKFYRFEYEESYKVIAPLYNTDDVVDLVQQFEEENGSDVPISIFDPRFVLVPRPHEQQTCYQTKTSTDVIITDTNELIEDRLDHFRVRFISREDYIMSYRYSILVNMYVQSFEAHAFYSTLKQFSQSESTLSQVQPGFFEGNIVSDTNINEKVIGFFDVSSIDTKRIYFNYADLFPGEPKPPYAVRCDVIAPSIIPQTPPPCRFSIVLACYIFEGWKYTGENFDPDPEDSRYGGPFFMVQRACGDCTVYGNSQPPDWWED